MTTFIKKNSFSGTGNVFDGTLADAVRALAQNAAIKAAASVANVTDSSGGVAAGAIPNVANFTLAIVSGTNAVGKTEADVTLPAVRSGISTLIAQANLIRGVVPAFDALVDNTGGSSGLPTLAAVDDSATAVSTGMVSATAVNTILRDLRSRLCQLTYFTNLLCLATGVTPLTNAMTAVYDTTFSNTFAAVAVATGSAVSGVDVTAANACITKAEWDTRFDTISNAFASIAAKLNAMTADANTNAVCTVVAA